MITAEDLRQIYKHDYVAEADGRITVKEHQDNPDALSEITFLFSGHITHIRSSIIGKSDSLYRTDAQRALILSKIFDGLLILDTDDDRHYIIYLEMKSGFNDVRKKAVQQIPASYLKINSLLRNFTSYDKSRYKELGLIVSYPPKSDTTDSRKVLAGKIDFIDKDSEEYIKEKYFKALREHSFAIFDGHDFYMDALKNVSPEILFKTLPVFYIAVEDKCVTTQIDLDDFINNVVNVKTAEK